MMIRYFCAVEAGHRGDLAHAYLVALSRLSVPVRAIPIGPAAMGIERRWHERGSLFTTPMETAYINVVCARPGMAMGTRTPMSTFQSDVGLPAELKRVLGSRPSRDSAGVFYEPPSAIAGLYTVGCKNVLIMPPKPLPQGDELVAIARYDLLLIPTIKDSGLTDLIALGLHPIHAPHDDPAFIAKLLEGLPGCESGIAVASSHGPESTRNEPAPVVTPPMYPTTSSWARRAWRFLTKRR